MSNLLINEQPLIVLPSLAAEIGLPESIILQQIHFLLGFSRNEHDGAQWVYNTQEDWLRVFLWIKDPKTIRRHMDRLESLNLIRVEKLSRYFGGNSFDQKLYYTVNYKALDALTQGPQLPLGQHAPIESVDMPQQAQNPDVSPSGQVAPMEPGNTPSLSCSPRNDRIGNIAPLEEGNLVLSKGDDLPHPSGQDAPVRMGQDARFSRGQNARMLQENTQENTQEKTPKDEDASAAAAPDEFAHIFNQPSGQRFPMPLDWQPTERLFELCQTRGISLEAMSPDQKGDLINEFRCYWNSQPEVVQSQGQWENKLVQRLVRVAAKQAGAMANLQQAGQPDRRTSRQAVTAAVMNIADTDW